MQGSDEQESDDVSGLTADLMDDFIDGSIGQYCSSCNQLRMPTDFERFLTCTAYRRRNTKAKHRRDQKFKEIIHKERL